MRRDVENQHLSATTGTPPSAASRVLSKLGEVVKILKIVGKEGMLFYFKINIEEACPDKY